MSEYAKYLNYYKLNNTAHISLVWDSVEETCTITRVYRIVGGPSVFLECVRREVSSPLPRKETSCFPLEEGKPQICLTDLLPCRGPADLAEYVRHEIAELTRRGWLDGLSPSRALRGAQGRGLDL